MSDDKAVNLSILKGQIETVLVRLSHARHSLDLDEDRDIKETCSRIDHCARQIAELSSSDRPEMQALLLAVLDEVEQTMKVFQDELERKRRDLTSTNQGRAAGAAYRQVQKF